MQLLEDRVRRDEVLQAYRQDPEHRRQQDRPPGIPTTTTTGTPMSRLVAAGLELGPAGAKCRFVDVSVEPRGVGEVVVDEAVDLRRVGERLEEVVDVRWGRLGGLERGVGSGAGWGGVAWETVREGRRCVVEAPNATIEVG